MSGEADQSTPQSVATAQMDPARQMPEPSVGRHHLGSGLDVGGGIEERTAPIDRLHAYHLFLPRR
jgi:hypothetical protein